MAGAFLTLEYEYEKQIAGMKIFIKNALLLSFIVSVSYYALTWLLFLNGFTHEPIIIYPAVMTWGKGFTSGDGAMIKTGITYLLAIWLIIFIVFLVLKAISNFIKSCKNNQ